MDTLLFICLYCLVGLKLIVFAGQYEEVEKRHPNRNKALHSLEALGRTVGLVILWPFHLVQVAGLALWVFLKEKILKL